MSNFQFTGIHLVGGNRHAHIANLRAVDTATGIQHFDSRAKWVAALEAGHSGFVRDMYGNKAVVGVRTSGDSKWLQTYRDGIWSDNLLALPRY